MFIDNHRVITKLLVSGAIALGSCVVAAAPAGADPNQIGPDPNPFSALSCSCQGTAPAGGPDVQEEIGRGLREGLSAWLPGLPAPTQPSQSQQ